MSKIKTKRPSFNEAESKLEFKKGNRRKSMSVILSNRKEEDFTHDIYDFFYIYKWKKNNIAF